MTADRSAADTVFAEHRGLLVAVAYRVLGSLTDAEDAAQDAWLRWRRVPADDVRDPRGFLVKVVTRLAIDRLRRRQARRETYAGDWLPEPLPTGGTVGDGAAHAELGEDVSTALLLVLETLSPLERAVFVLHEAFGYPHAEIGAILDRSESAVRQLARRARDHVAERRPRFDTDPEQGRRVAEQFMAASTIGDLEGLLSVLAPDVTLVTDSGGKVRAPLLPVSGAENVGRFLAAASTRELPDPNWRIVELNGAPGLVVTSEGRPVAAVTLEVAGGRVAAIYLVANPAKLGAFVVDP
jgi:RNA polymerase sigma-70 factor (ECF subfamily)